MTDRIILHIGAPKCGSTYLQRVMLKNQNVLRDCQINYPHHGQGHPGNGLNVDEISARWIEGAFAKSRTVVLSHEDLFALPDKGRRLANLAFKHGIELHIVAFFRKFADVLAADYSQTLKQNFKLFCENRQPFSGTDFFGFAKSRYAKIAPDEFFRDWRSLSSHFHLAQHSQIKATFENLIGIDCPIDWHLPRWKTNPSLPVFVCDEISAALRQGKIEVARTLLTNWPLANLSAQPEKQKQYDDFVNQLFSHRRKILRREFGFSA